MRQIFFSKHINNHFNHRYGPALPKQFSLKIYFCSNNTKQLSRGHLQRLQMTCKRKRLGAQEVMVFEYHRQVKQIQVNSTIITTIYNCKCVLWIPLFPLKKTNYTHSQFNILIVCDNVDTCVCLCVLSSNCFPTWPRYSKLLSSCCFEHVASNICYCVQYDELLYLSDAVKCNYRGC